MREYDGVPESVRELLLDAEGPMYHEDIQEELSLPEGYVGSALMELYDDDKVDWPAGDEWVALPDEKRTIQGVYAQIEIGIVNDE